MAHPIILLIIIARQNYFYQKLSLRRFQCYNKNHLHNSNIRDSRHLLPSGRGGGRRSSNLASLENFKNIEHLFTFQSELCFLRHWTGFIVLLHLYINKFKSLLDPIFMLKNFSWCLLRVHCDVIRTYVHFYSYFSTSFMYPCLLLLFFSMTCGLHACMLFIRV